MATPSTSAPAPAPLPSDFLSSPVISRRVQFPAQLPPRMHQQNQSRTSLAPTMESEEMDLTGDKEKAGDDPFGAHAAVSENASLASAEDLQEQLAAVREQMEVWVDPNEVDGMPATSSNPQASSEKKARALMRSYTSGAMGFLKHKKTGKPGDAFKSGSGAGKDVENGPVDSTPPLAANGGILAALIALNSQPESLPGSTNPSPGHSAATTPGGSPLLTSPVDSDDSDDEMERERFLAKQRAHRASKNAFHTTSAVVAGATKSAAATAFSLATGGSVRPRSMVDGGDRPYHRTLSSSNLAHNSLVRSASPSPPPSRPSSLYHHHRSHSQASLQEHFGHSSPPTSPVKKSFSSSALSNLVATASPPSPPSSPGLHRPKVIKAGAGVAKQLRRLGGHLGSEIDSPDARPEGARSGVGASKGHDITKSNPVGAASPSANPLAPIPPKAGWYKPNPHKSLGNARVRQSAENLPRVGSQPRLTREVSADSVPKTSRVGSPTPSLKKQPQEEYIEKTAEELYEEDEEPEMLSMPSRRTKKVPPNLRLKEMPAPSFRFNGLSSPGSSSPRRDSPLRDYFHKDSLYETEDERDQREWLKEKRKRRKAKEKKMRQEVFITQHVAAILSRQEFILKLARSFMMYGAPTHRLEAQIQATARVLELQLQCIYLPGLMLISFGDSQTHTSDVKFLKQANGLDLGRMMAAFRVYNKAVRDRISVTDASVQLDDLFIEQPKYKLWQHLIIGGLASAFIIPSAFYGSFVDCLAAIPLGALLVLVQVVVSRNDLYSSLFEIVIACLNAILAAALARTRQLCFSAVASGSVVLILPGYIVLCGSLELANRSIISGSVRLVYAILYALFLGFGLSMGSEVYQRIAGVSIEGATDFTCSALRVNAPWWRATIPQWWYFLSIPGFLLMLGLRNGQPFYRRETIVMVFIGAAGFSTNFFSARVFINRPDITSALGSLAVGVLSGVYAKLTHSSGFVVSIVGIFVQLPSGLANGGLLKFASDSTSGNRDAFQTGLTAAQSLVQVAIGLTVGLFAAAALVNLVFGGGRRRGANLSSL